MKYGNAEIVQCENCGRWVDRTEEYYFNESGCCCIHCNGLPDLVPVYGGEVTEFFPGCMACGASDKTYIAHHGEWHCTDCIPEQL